jgi:hypothetical protein
MAACRPAGPAPRKPSPSAAGESPIGQINPTPVITARRFGVITPHIS